MITFNDMTYMPIPLLTGLNVDHVDFVLGMMLLRSSSLSSSSLVYLSVLLFQEKAKDLAQESSNNSAKHTKFHLHQSTVATTQLTPAPGIEPPMFLR